MADFYRKGTITTLHKRGERSTADLERGLLPFSERRPLDLILPSLYSGIDMPALPAICQELKEEVSEWALSLCPTLWITND